MNHLARERSPYLLQHADNPVDWFPWGDAAFAKARAEDKPIFLSIGYSTCHWCHVMAHESFENAEIAAVLNEHFVAIKVDREERPDVDRVYMTFVQATTGAGGWPMSVWLTPAGKPFFGGTYFPPTSRWGRPGFVEVLRGDRARVAVDRPRGGAAGRIGDGAPEGAGARGAGRRSAGARRARACRGSVRSELRRAVRRLRRCAEVSAAERAAVPPARVRADRPRPARAMALATLQAMALGGMRDHVGGGFHRYAVDAAWRVPHFEKMLYDQAQLVLAYLEAAQASGEAFFAEVAEDTLAYVLREMTDPEGGFYSAEDADSVPPEHAGEPGAHATEGAFYLWREDEVDALAGADADDRAAALRRRAGRQRAGRSAAGVHRQEHSVRRGQHRRHRQSDWAFRGRRRRARSRARRIKLFEARVQRPRPHLDDKVLTAWNGLMIAAFARMARVVGPLRADADAARPYLDAAVRAAAFIRRRLWRQPERRLLAPVSRRRGRHRGLRRGLRVPDLRPPRALSGDRRRRMAGVGDRAAGPAGRAVLGRVGRRLVQHDRRRSHRAAADEGRLRRRRADGELGRGAQPARARRTSSIVPNGRSGSIGRSGSSACGSSRWAAACR